MKVMRIVIDLEVYAEAIKSGIEENWSSDYKVMIEPGRAVVNNAGLFFIPQER